MLGKVVRKASLQINVINIVLLLRITKYLFRHLHDFLSLLLRLLAVVDGTAAEAYADLFVIRVVLRKASSLAYVGD